MADTSITGDGGVGSDQPVFYGFASMISQLVRSRCLNSILESHVEGILLYRSWKQCTNP